MKIDIAMDIYTYVSELKDIYNSSNDFEHGIKKNKCGYKPFYPTKFMYTYFFFNTLCNVDWKESIATNSVIYDIRGDQTKIYSLLSFCFDRDFISKHKRRYKSKIKQNLEPLEYDQGFERMELEDELGDIVDNEADINRIDDRLRKKTILSITNYLFKEQFCYEDAINIATFIYYVRCNIFHGSKTFDMMQDDDQQRRLTIYTVFIDSFIKMLFDRINDIFNKR